jgi:hypothetical protein
MHSRPDAHFNTLILLVQECMESYWEWEYSRHKFLKVNVLAHLICKTTTY